MLPAPVLALLCVAGLATLEGAVATGVVVPEAFRALTGSLDAHGLVHPFSNNKRQIYAFGVNGTDGTTPTGTGIVPVELSEDGQSYHVVARIGNIPFRFALDTGSADTWLFSTACQDKVCATSPKYPLMYNSPTYGQVQNNGTGFNISFADTTRADGFVAMESVQISNITAPSQAIGLISSSNVTFGSSISGVLGLSFPRLSTISRSLTTGTPFFSTLAQQGMVSYPLFGLSLRRDSAGSLTLGAIDASVLTNVSLVQWNPVYSFAPFNAASLTVASETSASSSSSAASASSTAISTVPVARNASGYLHWAIKLDGFGVNGTEFQPWPTYVKETGNASLALIDVGLPGIVGPFQDVKRIFEAIPNARLVDEALGQWAVPCTTSLTLSFKFGNTNFTLQPTDYLIGPAVGTPNMCLSWPRGRQPGTDGIEWTLGQNFLRTVYSIWSYGINRKEAPMIGFFPLRNASAPAEIQSPESIASFFATASATVGTTLPNFFLPTPTVNPTPTAPYTFNTSFPLTAGTTVTSDLGTSTYVPLLAHASSRGGVNASAFASVVPSPTALLVTITDEAGATHTSLSLLPVPSIALGAIPGTSSATRSHGLGASPLISVLSAVCISYLVDAFCHM